MGACGCGFNHDGVRVRACERHAKLKVLVTTGEKLRVGKPKLAKRDQRAYYARYRSPEYQALKAAGKTRRGRALGAKVAAGLKRAPGAGRPKKDKDKAVNALKRVEAVDMSSTTSKLVSGAVSKSVAKRVAAQKVATTQKAAPKPDSKGLHGTAEQARQEMKRARDARYRASKKAAKEAAKAQAETATDTAAVSSSPSPDSAE